MTFERGLLSSIEENSELYFGNLSNRDSDDSNDFCEFRHGNHKIRRIMVLQNV